MTVSRRILWQFVVAAGLVIVVSSAVTYKLVFDAAAQRNLDVLRTYVTERTRREEAEFRNIEGNLRLVRGQFEKRMEAAMPPFMNDRWEGRFRLFPDGAWRSREEFADGRRYSTMWMHKDATLTAQLQVQILRAQDICDELIRGWVDSFPSVHFVFKGPVNIVRVSSSMMRMRGMSSSSAYGTGPPRSQAGIERWCDEQTDRLRCMIWLHTQCSRITHPASSQFLDRWRVATDVAVQDRGR